MNALFFILFTLFLIIVQTIVFPSFTWFVQCFDLMIINVLFLSLISSHYSMVFAIVLIGCIMDSISGVPFSFHVFSYVWVYIIVHLAKQLVFKQSSVFLFIIGLISVLIQQGLLVFSIFVTQSDTTLQVFDFNLMIRQIFWGFVLIPPGVWLVKAFWRSWIFTTRLFQKQLAHKYRG